MVDNLLSNDRAQDASINHKSGKSFIRKSHKRLNKSKSKHIVYAIPKPFPRKLAF